MNKKKNGIIFYFVNGILISSFRDIPQVPGVGHAKVIRKLNSTSLKRSMEIYNSSCKAGHGKDGLLFDPGHILQQKQS